jgi:hypothetical protein
MPEKETLKRARRAKRQGKSPSSQAGEFVREEIHHVREGKHGARSTKQAIAIGLSKARRAGVKLGTPRNASKATQRAARRDSSRAGKTPSRSRSRGMLRALKREGRGSASRGALAKHARQTARQRGPTARRAAARKAARTKGPAGRRAAAKKAARTRASNA